MFYKVQYLNMGMSINYFIAVVVVVIVIIELTHILENTVKIEPQPVALDFKNLSQYSSRSK